MSHIVQHRASVTDKTRYSEYFSFSVSEQMLSNIPVSAISYDADHVNLWWFDRSKKSHELHTEQISACSAHARTFIQTGQNACAFHLAWCTFWNTRYFQYNIRYSLLFFFCLIPSKVKLKILYKSRRKLNFLTLFTARFNLYRVLAQAEPKSKLADFPSRKLNIIIKLFREFSNRFLCLPFTRILII